MNRDISLLDKTFTPYLSSESIKNRIDGLAAQLNADYKGESVVFIGVLNGAFMFASDLMKGLDLDLEVSFIKVSSYSGTQSSGKVKELIGLNNSINQKHGSVVE
jgi:hypoxanthine phosphoribosyltransferase